MKKKFKIMVISAVLLCIVFFILIYTRPLTIEQRYPVLDLSQCTQISGDYRDGSIADRTQFTIHPEDPHFDEMIELFQSTAFHTRLRNIFPPKSKTHRYHTGVFQWTVQFRFEDVSFPNGDTASGHLLYIDNFFGDLELRCDGKEVLCSVKNQEQWLDDVMVILEQYAN